MSELRRLMMAKKVEGGGEKWDYDWDWKRDGIAPPMATYSYKTESSDFLSAENLKLDFNYMGKCEIEAVIDATYSIQNAPQIIVRSTAKNGAKVWKQQNISYLYSNITGSNVNLNLNSNTKRVINLRLDEGGISLTIDGTSIYTNRQGVTNNSYLTVTGIDGSASGNGGGTCRYYSIKFRKL